MSYQDRSYTDVSGVQIGLIGLFVVSLMTAQVTGAKLGQISLPLLGVVLYPTGTVAYAGTFFATDCMSELYGREFAAKVVNIAFLMNFVLLALIWWAIRVPNSGVGIPQGEFELVLASSLNIVAGSLIAYIISQNWDVFFFHEVREATDSRFLWLRNIASTGTSQFIDTVVFTFVAFMFVPAITGIGHQLSFALIISGIIGQYVVKLIIAGVDTPLVYGAVYLVRGNIRDEDGVVGA